jgi:hypothetical protein
MKKHQDGQFVKTPFLSRGGSLLRLNFFISLIAILALLMFSSKRMHAVEIDIPPLIFASSTTGAPVNASEQWKKINYSYDCVIDDTKAFIQINFGRTAGKIFFRNFVFSEDGKNILETNFKDASWKNTLKLIDARNIGINTTTAHNAIEITVPSRVEFPWDAQLCSNKINLIKGKSYSISFEVRAEREWRISSYLMRMNPLRFYASAGNDMFMRTSEFAVVNGITTLSPSLVFPWPENDNDYASELTIITAYLDRLKAKHPNGKWMLRIGVEPPAWWRRKNPEEMLQWEDGTTSSYVCIASEKWRHDVRAHLKNIITHCEKHWADMIIAYIPVGQSTGEWYYPIWINRSHGTMNHSPAFTSAYRKFLKREYGDDIAILNKAWNKKYSSFSGINVPSGKERQYTSLGIFRHPQKERELFDFTEFQQFAMRTALEAVASDIKKYSDKGRKVFAFYGYLLELCGVRDGIGETGHLQLGELLKNGILDGVVDIVSYYDRGAGRSGCLMTPVESITRHGRILITEDDSRTHLSSKDAGYERTSSLEETIWAQGRNFARSLVHRAGTWKFDLYGEGWFADKKLWSELTRISEAWDKQKNNKSFQSEIAVFIDEKSFMALRPGHELTRPLIYELRANLAKTGYGETSYWLLEDLLAGRVKAHYKLLIFPNAFMLSNKEKACLRNYLSKNKATALWIYAPGYLSDNGEDFDGMKFLTGFDFKKSHVKSEDSMLLENDENIRKINFPKGIDEYFYISETSDVKPLGRLSSNQEVVLYASTEKAGYSSYFHALPNIDTELFAEICKRAGVWRYTDKGNVVINSDGFICLTSPKGGSVKLRLPQKSIIRDLYGVIIAESDTIEIEFKPKETKYFITEEKQ